MKRLRTPKDRQITHFTQKTPAKLKASEPTTNHRIYLEFFYSILNNDKLFIRLVILLLIVSFVAVLAIERLYKLAVSLSNDLKYTSILTGLTWNYKAAKQLYSFLFV